MTKRELLKRYEELLESKKIRSLDGVWTGSNKSTILNAIKCLECSDEEMEEYLTVIKLKYPNTYRTIVGNGDYKTHPHNRLYVFNTARIVLQ